jgi:hypothetical protein
MNQPIITKGLAAPLGALREPQAAHQLSGRSVRIFQAVN